jgi:putative methionine-R-sulfoxide reductase with GAF domain/ligand-binding sensor domain-containing protein
LQKLTAISAFLVFIFCHAEMYGQLPDYHVQVINTRNGVNLAGATELIQDHKGFLWILSENNLQRYDGKSVKIFEPAPILKNVICDADGVIWCVSQRSVHRFVNDHTGFEQIAIDTLSNHLFAIHQLPDKSFWVSHTKGLMRYSPQKKEFENIPLPFVPATGKKASVPSRVIKGVDVRGEMFCLTQFDTVYVYNSRTKEIRSKIFPRLNYTIFSSDSALLLVGFDAHTYKWDLSSHTLTPFTYDKADKTGENFFYARQALRLGQDDNYLLSNKGLLRVSGQTPQVKKIRIFVSGMPLLGEENIRWITRGPDGKIFLLHNDAILFFEHQPRYISTIKNFSYDLSKNFGNRPTECLVDEHQNLWIGSYDGFTKWNLNTNEFKRYKALAGAQKETLQHPVVWHIAYDGKNILLAPDQQGLLLFDPRSERFSRPVFPQDSAGKKLESQVNKATIYFIRKLRDKNFLMANRYGVFIIEKDTYRVVPLNLPKDKVYYLSAIQMTNGDIWFATMLGLVGIDKNYKIINELKMPGKDKEAVVLCETGNGELVTGNKEIYKVSNLGDSNPVFRSYLPFFKDRSIFALYKDALGYIWISTADAVYRYNTLSNMLTRVSNPDFVVRQHQLNGLFESTDGTVFFCGENGVNYFNPNKLARQEQQVPVFITNVTVNNDDSTYLTSGSIASRLSYYQNSLVFDFVSPAYGAFPAQYRYRLQGFDREWIEAGSNNQVRYASLPPGDYTFEVAASVDGINWHSASRSVTVAIAPPFWKTPWFALVCAGVLAMALYIIYRYRSSRREEKEVKQMIDYFANSGYEHSSVDDILWDIARNCISRLNFEDCVIYLLDEDRGMLLQKAAYGPKAPKAFEIMNPIDIPLGKGIVGAVAQTGKTEVISDTTQDERYIVDDQARYSELTVPIVHEGNVIGIIDSEHRRRNFFKKKHVQVLQTIANLCSAKISRGMALDAMRKSKLQLMELNMKMAESKFLNLRLQMNPHFLFNSLSSIQHLVVSQQTSRAYKYLTVFSNLLRSLLQYAESNFISLDKEMAMLRMYLDLETLRFDESFKYTIDVDESLTQEDVLLPSLMVQPFAENAIWHGLMHKEGDKKLHIRFNNHHDDYLTCIVEDNGIGRRAAAAIRRKNISTMVHESKGIRIIEERLKLLQQKTGKPAHVEIIDKADDAGGPAGTKIMIVIPFYNKEEV